MVSSVVRVLAQQFSGEKVLFVMEMEFSGLHIALCHAVQKAKARQRVELGGKFSMPWTETIVG